jgi:soluble lytic murein transglycosylase-like protein
LPAKIIITAIGVLVAAAGLSGCTSTSQMKAAPALAEASTPVVADDTPTLALPETVAVLPEPSGLAQVQTAALAGDAVAMATTGLPATPGAPATQGTPATQSALLPPPVQPGAPAAALAQPAAFAGATPMAGKFPPPPMLTAGGSPTGPGSIKQAASMKQAAVYTTAGVAMPVTGQSAKVAPMPGVQQVAYVAPENPALLAAPGQPEVHASGPRAEIERLIEKYSAIYEVPVELVRHVVNRESTFNPKAFNHGHWGLMQIKHATARGMGYDGPATGLFDAETNLKYAVKYLRGAWLVSGGNAKRADTLYQTGYYYDAKRKGLLEATGLGVDHKRRRLQPDA